MLFIAHRGNLYGKNPQKENDPSYIETAISKGFSVEIDLRTRDDEIFLGHDDSQYKINLDWLNKHSNHLWVHCKDTGAFKFAIDNNLHYFWHDTDEYTLTSKNYVWAYPGKKPVGNFCIMVMPEIYWSFSDSVNFPCYGICSDYVEDMKEKFDKKKLFL